MLLVFLLPVGLKLLDCWARGFESLWRMMFVSCAVVCSGVCDNDHSCIRVLSRVYTCVCVRTRLRARACVCACALARVSDYVWCRNRQWGGLGPSWAVASQKKFCLVPSVLFTAWTFELFHVYIITDDMNPLLQTNVLLPTLSKCI